MKRLLLLAGAALLAAGLLLACRGPAPGTTDAGDHLAPEKIAADVRAALDPTVDPCEDFYRYACGGWLATTELPPDRPRWGRGFSAIAERNLALEREILEQAAANPGDDPGLRKIGDYYAACMDEDAIEQAGLEPLRPWLEKIEAVDGPESLFHLAGEMFLVGAPVLFDAGVDADFANPDLYIAHFLQGGLGMPDREYYLDPGRRPLLERYRAFVARMLALTGEDEDTARRHADAIVALETRLAQASKPRRELRDPQKIYHKIDREGLVSLAPRLPWDAFFAGVGRTDVRDINVATPDFFPALQETVLGADLDTLRAYLRFHLVQGLARFLPRDFVEAAFEFYGKTLSGQQELRPRWKRCVAAVDDGLGELLGRAFVERAFAGESRDVAREMIGNVEAAFERNLEELDWMDEATKARAREKLHAIVNKVGYPDRWRTYDGVEVDRRSWFASGISARRFEAARQIRRIGQPVDRSEWHMTPPTVNAYYNPSANEMVFPAGILQPPFFHRDFPSPMNYGGMGMVMGHELTHGFDDQGRKFDGHGRMSEWWTPAVAKAFEERAACIEEQYAAYEVQPGVHLDGKLTLGENLADNGGIRLAWKAWSALGDDASLPGLDLTPQQLFFVAFAQTWCTVASPEYEKLAATVDPHSAPRFRVSGPLSILPAFAEAFGCREGTPMNPREKCRVW